MQPPPPQMQPVAPVVAPVMVPVPQMPGYGKFEAEPVKLEDPNAPGPFARLPGVPPPLVAFPGAVPM